MNTLYVINNFLESMTPEQHRIAYFAMHAVGFLCAVLYIVFHGKKYKITADQRLMLILVVVVMAISVQVLAMFYEAILGVSFRNLAHTLLLLGPLVLLESKITETAVHKNLDIMAPMFMIAKGVSGLGCLFWGCCGGIEVPWGIYSFQRDAYIVPVQILEFILTLLLVLWSMWFEKRQRYVGEGKAFGWTVTVYGLIRFITDALRVKERLFWRTSIEGVFALSFILTGIVALIVCYRHGGSKYGKN